MMPVTLKVVVSPAADRLIASRKVQAVLQLSLVTSVKVLTTQPEASTNILGSFRIGTLFFTVTL